MKKFLSSLALLTLLSAPAHATTNSDILVRLAPADDLALSNSLSKNERGQIVYDHLRRHAQKTQKKLLDLLRGKGVEFRAFYIENMVEIPHATPALVRELTALGLNVGANPLIHAVEPVVDLPRIELRRDGTEIPDDLKSVGADRVWNELRVKGEGIVIAGQDTGYFWQHPALKKQYRGFMGMGVNHNYSWHDSIHRKLSRAASSCSPDSPEPCDDRGHGTHTMGTMVGDDGAANKIGVAPEAKWIGCRNMDAGVGTAASYLECFEYFLAPYPLGGNAQTDGRPDLAPHVINNSWGCPKEEGCTGGEFLAAVRALKAAGIVVVVAAGNEGPNCGTVGDPPGSYYGELISVAAFDHRNGNITGFSSRGPSAFNGGLGVNVSAPGSLIRSAVPSGGSSDPLYDFKSGTSMAAPHVAGVVALLWSARPELVGRVQDTIDLLQKSARGKTSTQTCGSFPGGAVPNAVFGYGYVDAFQAIKN